jgi:molybdate transport system ATP-binding protein
VLDARIALQLGDFDLDIELHAKAATTVALLGPNGAGKTTALRALCGLLAIDDGRIALHGRVLDDPRAPTFVPPEKRAIGTVFQDYRLFPHLSALDNVAFGLRARGVRRRAARAEAARWLEIVGVDTLANARPHALSGGQAQRVALARALALRPRLLVLDEPLAALDATTRAETRRALRSYLAAHDGARVLVTHDPLDAAILADEIIVIERGRVVQTGSPHDIAARPRSPYVADLVGVNLLHGQSDGHRVTTATGELVVASAPVGQVFAVIHPRAVVIHRQPPEGSARNAWPGRIASVDDEGDRTRIRIDAAVSLVAEVTRAGARELGLTAGAHVWAAVKATEISVYEA